MNHIGNRIKALRKNKGMTQKELGEVLGVQKAAVQKIESSPDPNLTADKVRLLAKTFRVYPRTFIYADQEDFWKQVLHYPNEDAYWARVFDINKPAVSHLHGDSTEGLEGQRLLEEKLGLDLMRLLLALVRMNKRGLRRTEIYIRDMLKIEEYRLPERRGESSKLL